MVIVTAEIGINHNGDIEIAKNLIEIAKSAGCDAVKFQKRTVEKVYSESILDSPRESPWGKTTRDQKLGLEFGKKEYDEINQHCLLYGIDWFASSWDLDSQSFLCQYNLKYNKIASAMLTNSELLKTVAKEKKHTFISTGMSTMEEIGDAVNIFREHNCPFELMHANSSYPMKIEEANLLCIPMLKKKFNCDVGYSGHEVSAYRVSLIAVSLGATSLERHITLDRTMYGSDQAVSQEPTGLKRMVRDIRDVVAILGDGKKQIWDSEIPVRKKLRGL
jgi:N-acetylneuraminate synthase